MTPKVFRPVELLKQLNDADVRYVIVGALALGTWGFVRGTDDLDVVPDPTRDNLERLQRVLESLDGRVVIGDQVLAASAIATFLRAGDRTLVRTSLGEIDVLQGLPQIPRYGDLASSAVDVEIEGVQAKVCSLADLRAMKRASGRGQDRLDLEALEIAHPEDSQSE